MEYTDGIPSPPNFRLWSAISAVSGALERRVWVETARRPLYANLFCLLVAPPGVGKTNAIDNVKALWRQSKKFKICPSSVTKASLIDNLEKATSCRLTSSGSMVEYTTLLVTAGELGVLLPAHDLEFLSVLNDLYDNPPDYIEDRRTGNKHVEVNNPQIMILAGSQPAFLASLLPEEAWAMGTTSRMLMVYSATGPTVDLFDDDFSCADPKREALWKSLLARICAMSDLIGVFTWDKLAQELIQTWHRSGCEPVPEHSKLQHYLPRRIIHTIKLSMISAVARTGVQHITAMDVTRAREWLLSAERTMPDIFRDMVHKSDSDVLQELHFFLWRIWIKDRKPIHASQIYHFLSAKVISERIPRVLDIAEKSSIIQRCAGVDAYIPRAKHEHGME